MKLARLSVLGAFVAASGLAGLAACSSSSTSGTTTDAGTKDSGLKTDSSTGSDSGMAVDSSVGSDTGSASDSSASDSSMGMDTAPSCTITPGTYTVTNTAVGDAGPGCPPPNSMITWPLPAPDAATDASVPDSGIACTTTTSGCTTTTTCMGVTGGFNYSSTNAETVTGGIPSGMNSYSLTASDGGIVSECTYTFTWGAGGGDGGADQ